MFTSKDKTSNRANIYSVGGKINSESNRHSVLIFAFSLNTNEVQIESSPPQHNFEVALLNQYENSTFDILTCNFLLAWEAGILNDLTKKRSTSWYKIPRCHLYAIVYWENFVNIMH